MPLDTNIPETFLPGFRRIESIVSSMGSFGDFADLPELTSIKTFITSFAGHIAAKGAT